MLSWLSHHCFHMKKSADSCSNSGPDYETDWTLVCTLVKHNGRRGWRNGGKESTCPKVTEVVKWEIAARQQVATSLSYLLRGLRNEQWKLQLLSISIVQAAVRRSSPCNLTCGYKPWWRSSGTAVYAPWSLIIRCCSLRPPGPSSRGRLLRSKLIY